VQSRLWVRCPLILFYTRFLWKFVLFLNFVRHLNFESFSRIYERGARIRTAQFIHMSCSQILYCKYVHFTREQLAIRTSRRVDVSCSGLSCRIWSRQPAFGGKICPNFPNSTKKALRSRGLRYGVFIFQDHVSNQESHKVQVSRPGLPVCKVCEPPFPAPVLYGRQARGKSIETVYSIRHAGV